MNHNDIKKTENIRREYGQLQLDEAMLPHNPYLVFEQWLHDALAEKTLEDPTAMVLSTVDISGAPDSRVVLLKEVVEERFIFYTNYESPKALQLEKMPYCALNFYWQAFARQVRIRGVAQKLSPKDSEDYFAKRPHESQVAALASLQSQPIESRSALQNKFEKILNNYKGKSVKCPDNWGGYAVIPYAFEFWQGRDNRLHDRIYFYQEQGVWCLKRLQP